jgi:CheY-like chemotaxis protein
MNRTEFYKVLQTISIELSRDDDAIRPLPANPDWKASLEDLGIDIISAQDLFGRLNERILSKKFHVPPSLPERLHLIPDLGALCDELISSGFGKPKEFEVVYVDDESENLFVFRRVFEKDFPVKCFESPVQALDYIRTNPKVRLVITDEVMPEMNGNTLRDKVAELKPDMKFILITGNPESDNNLMYKTLAKNRFFDFMQKPVDFRAQKDKLTALFKELSTE